MSYSASISVRCAIAAWLCVVAAGACLSQDQISAEKWDATEFNAAETDDFAERPRTTFRLRGRLDADALTTLQSAANETTFGDLGDAVGLRRAWIGAQGDLAIGGRCITEVDLAPGNIVVRDVFVGLGKIPDEGECRAGHFLEPFSLELGTLSYVLPFMECSAISLLDPARNWGLGFFRADVNDSTLLALGVFQAGTDANDFQGGAGSTVGFTGKLTAAPINEGDGERLLHFGLALSERLPEYGTIFVGQQPQSSLLGLGDVASSPFVPSIRIPANFQQLVNLQCAAVKGPLWAQAEWNGSWIDQRGGGPVFFHGWHADCGWFVTGEHRSYQSTSGTFGVIKVNRPVIQCHANRDRPAGWGAWELTARMAYLDFRDSDTPLNSVGQLQGLRLPEATLGVNWYLADHLRLMFNYTYAVPDEPNFGTSVANIYGARIATFW